MRLALLIGACLVAGLAHAQSSSTGTSDPTSPTLRASDTTQTATEGGTQLRASHRVDVIAPGEKVESVIDRMRTQSTTQAASAERSRVDAAPLRPAEKRGERAGGETTPRGRGPATGSNGPTPPPMRGDAPPPDRPRR